MYPLWQMRQGLSFDDSAASKGCRGSGSERMAKLYRMADTVWPFALPVQ